LIGRWLELEGCANARVLVDGVLLRSDNLQDLTAADVATLVEAEGLTDVVDLRTGAEVALEGPHALTRDERVRIEHRSLYPETGGHTDIDADVLAIWGDRKGADLPDESPTVQAYVGYLERRPDSVVGALRDLAGAQGATLVHCAAGKDRTGMVVMLALLVGGFHRDQVVADYLLTRERIEAIVERLASSATYRDEIRTRDPQAHAPRPGTMERVLELIDARHGGAEAYLRNHGMDAAELAALRARLDGARVS
jgi:protein tyrosine/serine phosphatase